MTKTRLTVSCLAVAMLAGTTHAQQAAPEVYPLMGVVRDFAPQHQDFTNNPGDGAASSAGSVARTLGTGGVPTYTGGGAVVTSPARDVSGRAIAPHLYTANATVGPVTDFTISGGTRIKAGTAMAAKVRVIGAAISRGGTYDLHVTTQVRVGSQTQTPFGSFDAGVSGNVNDNNNPRSAVLTGMIPAGTELTIDGRSWDHAIGSLSYGNDQDWEPSMTVNSADGGHQVVALRNGDTPPNVAGFMGQVSAKDMLSPYLDDAGKIKLLDNQVIYLFELGVTDTGSRAFDQQDLVVLVDLATDPSYFEDTVTTSNACMTIRDTAADMGDANDGRVTSADSFATWFTNAAGQNASKGHAIDMLKGDDGVYSFSAPNFDPAHAELYALPSGPNRGFTYAIDASGTYTQCGRQFLEVGSDTDAWVFINGSLVIDMGGTHQGAVQVVDIDRLGLSEGDDVHVQIFYAQRSTDYAAFSLRTNLVLTSRREVAPPGVSGLHD